MKRAGWSVAILAAFAGSGLAQNQGPAPVLEIIRETIKEGKGALHAKTETEYVQAYRKARDQTYYLAASALSGPNEAWFFVGSPSFEAFETERKKSDKEPLKSELEAADAHDGALRESTRTMWAVFRPDLSYRADKFDLGRSRYFTAGTYRVKLGRESEFTDTAKQILGAYEKGSVDAVLLCYQVVAGAPSGTYIFFAPMASLKTMDGMKARQATLRQAMGSDNFDRLMRGSGDTFNGIESQLFEVSPGMSYVSAETMAEDPAFWTPKPAAKPKPAQ